MSVDNLYGGISPYAVDPRRTADGLEAKREATLAAMLVKEQVETGEWESVERIMRQKGVGVGELVPLAIDQTEGETGWFWARLAMGNGLNLVRMSQDEVAALGKDAQALTEALERSMAALNGRG